MKPHFTAVSLLAFATLSATSFAPPLPPDLNAEFAALIRIREERSAIVSKGVLAEGAEWERVVAAEQKVSARGYAACIKLREHILKELDFSRVKDPSKQFSVVRLTHMLAATNAESDIYCFFLTRNNLSQAKPKPKKYNEWNDASDDLYIALERAYEAAVTAYQLSSLK